MTQSQKIAVTSLSVKHSADVRHFGCRIITTDIGYAVVLSVCEGEGENLKLRYSYTIGKRGGIS